VFKVIPGLTEEAGATVAWSSAAGTVAGGGITVLEAGSEATEDTISSSAGTVTMVLPTS
jgi:hypothetical protein